MRSNAKGGVGGGKRNNSNYVKQRRSSQIAITIQEWNFRVKINSSIKMSAQCLTVVKEKQAKLTSCLERSRKKTKRCIKTLIW